jgi:hypothetical protein
MCFQDGMQLIGRRLAAMHYVCGVCMCFLQRQVAQCGGAEERSGYRQAVPTLAPLDYVMFGGRARQGCSSLTFMIGLRLQA